MRSFTEPEELVVWSFDGTDENVCSAAGTDVEVWSLADIVEEGESFAGTEVEDWSLGDTE